MKKTIAILCFVVMLLATAVAFEPKTDLNIRIFNSEQNQYITESVTSVGLFYGQEALQTDVPGFIYRGRTLVPIYLIGQLLDAQVDWNQEFSRASIQTKDKLILLTIGSRFAIVNGKQVEIPDGVSVMLANYNGSARTMVPCRFVAEQLGCNVSWNADKYVVTLALPGETVPENSTDPTKKVITSIDQVVVVLDAGHGGDDPGAYYFGTSEKDINLAVTKKVEAILRARGLQIYLTRTDDSKVTLAERTTFANNLGADIFVSIHSNAAENAPTASGIETYYHPNAVEGKILAQYIQTAIIQSTAAKDRKIKSENLYVCRNSKMPAALVELGFMSTESELNQLITEEYQNSLAQGIADGIIAYAETLLSTDANS